MALTGPANILRNRTKPPAAPTVGTRVSPGTVPAPNPFKGITKPPSYVHPLTAPKPATAPKITPMPVKLPGGATYNPVMPGVAAPSAAPGAFMTPEQWAAKFGAINGAAQRDKYWAYRASVGAPVPGSPQGVAADAAKAEAARKQALADATSKFDWSLLDTPGEQYRARANFDLESATGQKAIGAWDPATKSYNWSFQDLDGDPNTGGALQQQLQQQMDALALQEIMAKQSSDESNFNVDSNAASRGMYKSGIRDLGRGKVLAQLTNALSGITQGRTGAQTAYQSALDRALADYKFGMNEQTTTSGNNRWIEYLKSLGLG